MSEEKSYSVTILSNHGGVIVEEVVVKPRGAIPLHRHPKEDNGEQKIETYFWQRGKGILQIESSSITWPEKPGHVAENGGVGQPAYPIPAGAWHGVTNTGDVPLVFWVTYLAPSSGAFKTLFE